MEGLVSDKFRKLYVFFSFEVDPLEEESSLKDPMLSKGRFRVLVETEANEFPRGMIITFPLSGRKAADLISDVDIIVAASG